MTVNTSKDSKSGHQEVAISVELLKTIRGPRLKAGERVRLNYRLALSAADLRSHCLLDHSEWHEEPVIVEVGKAGELLQGLEECLMDYCRGDTLCLSIPPEKAFGSRGIPNRVPPDATIFAEIEISTKEIV